MSKSPLHLEIQKHRSNCYGVIRSSYREDGKVKHKSFGRISGCSFEQLRILQEAFRGNVVLKNSKEAPKITDSKEYGASFSLLNLAKNIGLDKTIFSKPEKQWVKDVLAMIVGRVIYAGSKLSLANQYDNTSLWELSNVDGIVDVDKHCYASMDELLKRQSLIQKKLAKKHLNKGSLILYDITSSYLEGEYNESELVHFGYNRDGKKGHEQVVIGLICNHAGCPIAVEVYPGNTKDESTVLEKVKEVKNKYGIDEMIFVGDRGMVTRSNIEKIKELDDIHTISALTRSEIFELLERKVIQPELFDESDIHEIIDPDHPRKRYCLCKNPLSAAKDKATRDRLLEITEKELVHIQQYKRKTTSYALGARIGKILAKYKMGKYIEWEVNIDKKNISSNNHQVIWKFNHAKIQAAQKLDGCYIISTDVSGEKLKKNEVVSSYKKLELVEQAFRNLKTVQLETRPIYHKTDERIKCHVFICMLSYYLMWHMKKCLKPFFDSDGKKKHRKWTFQNIIETLKCIRKQTVTMNGIKYKQISTPNKHQQQILDLLSIKL